MKQINDYIIERGSAPVFDLKNKKIMSRNPAVNMVQTIIDELSKQPDYKGKDKELWTSAGQFLYDYLKELSNKDYSAIIKELDLPDLRNSDKDEFNAASVQAAIALKLTNK